MVTPRESKGKSGLCDVAATLVTEGEQRKELLRDGPSSRLPSGECDSINNNETNTP